MGIKIENIILLVYLFYILMENTTISYTCNISYCNKNINNNSDQITDHIKLFHPVIYRYLKFPDTIYRCHTCRRYTASQHKGCVPDDDF